LIKRKPASHKEWAKMKLGNAEPCFECNTYTMSTLPRSSA
jgi:hypothetical protein